MLSITTSKWSRFVTLSIIVIHFSKHIKKEYETFVLTIGDFDECVFLNEDASHELGTAELQSSNGFEQILHHAFVARNTTSPATSNSIIPQTPLSSRQYLQSRTPINKNVMLTPISTAVLSIGRIKSMLDGCESAPSEKLVKIFELCKDNVNENIATILARMGDVFVKAYSSDCSKSVNIQSSSEIQVSISNDFAQERLNLAMKFFYSILEKILDSEQKRHKIDKNKLSDYITNMMNKTIFIRSLFACCLEIIRFSYSPTHRTFPWILNIFDIEKDLKIHPFFFYKVIEPVIREEGSLSRNLVKHLNVVEEKILESMAWTRDSPLWHYLEKIEAPTCEQVSLNIHDDNSSGHSSALITDSPAFKPNSSSLLLGNKQLPKRQLFGSDSSEVKQEEGDSESVSPNKDIFVAPKQMDSEMVKPLAKYGQVGLFFRKVYHLASIRLKDYYPKLNIVKESVQMKIWACLEHALSKNTELMCEHHLDQLIMCSIFAICKAVTTNNLPFQVVIESYRRQPQYASSVSIFCMLNCCLIMIFQTYRDVLIGICKPLNKTTSNNTPFEQIPRKDIIEFYNSVFLVKHVKINLKKIINNDSVSARLFYKIDWSSFNFCFTELRPFPDASPDVRCVALASPSCFQFECVYIGVNSITSSTFT